MRTLCALVVLGAVGALRVGPPAGVGGRRAALARASAAAVAGVLAPAVASADGSRAQQRTIYDRMTPRIQSGADWYTTDLKKFIEKEDWASVGAAFTNVVTAVESRKAEPIKSSYLERQFYDPMKIWCTSFADKSITPTIKALTKHEADFEKAMAALEEVLPEDPNPGGGFFGFGKKRANLDAKSRKKAAMEAYAAGRAAYNEYIEVANRALPRNVPSMPLMP